MREAISVRRIDGDEAIARAEALADVLIDCVDGGASVSFMAPLPRSTALAFWLDIAAAVARRERVLLIAEDASGQLVGTVQLIVSLPENQPHRGRCRQDAGAPQRATPRRRPAFDGGARRGRAQRGQERAGARYGDRRRCRTPLSARRLAACRRGAEIAERLYQRAGWQRVGVVPKYALMPDGEFCATTFFLQTPERGERSRGRGFALDRLGQLGVLFRGELEDARGGFRG